MEEEAHRGHLSTKRRIIPHADALPACNYGLGFKQRHNVCLEVFLMSALRYTNCKLFTGGPFLSVAYTLEKIYLKDLPFLQCRYPC